jgi:putative phosphoribosyl transferase
MIIFDNREHAGVELAGRLNHYKNDPDVMVLGIPRGGVVVAGVVARELNAPLDVFITRKIGAPFNEELALGAVAGDGTVFLDRELIFQLGVETAEVEAERKRQLQEVERRSALYRGDRPPLSLRDKTAILVDDGVATGSTTIAALRALGHSGASRRVLAVPVAPIQVVPALRAECDELVILDTPQPFIAVGHFYRNFGQTTDAEVIAILDQARGAK